MQPPEKLEARVLNCTLKRKPSDGSTHWSSYKLAAELGNVSVSTVQRIWRKHGVRPHRLERHLIPATERGQQFAHAVAVLQDFFLQLSAIAHQMAGRFVLQRRHPDCAHPVAFAAQPGT